MRKSIIRNWAWVGDKDIEAESWNSGGKTRETAIAAARSRRFKKFMIAPCCPATLADVRKWHGDHHLRVGDSMVDTDRIEEFPKRKR